MKVQYIEKTKYAYFNGYKFTKDDKTGYYLSSNIDGKRYRLHRYVWEYYNGEIPKGYHVHHKDHNKNNNEINNLELLTKKEHSKRHALEMTDEIKEKYRENLNKNARPKAIEWHKSKEGREWHKKHFENSLAIQEKKVFECEYCKKEYQTFDNGKNRFCSKKCQSAYRRESGIDNIERICLNCKQPFMTNKYGTTKYCYNCRPKRKRRC
jgi:hypothetical protein